MNRLPDIQEIWNHLEFVYKHPRNVSKRFQTEISSRTKDIKQFSKLYTHGHTDMSKCKAYPTRGGSAKNNSSGHELVPKSYIFPDYIWNNKK